MKMVAYDKKELENVMSYKRTKWSEFLDEFAESDLDCVKIEEYEHTSVYSCAAALNKAIGRFHKDNMKAIVHNGELFLMKIN